MKAFGYVRVSSKGQVSGDGFERQEKAIRECAKSNGFEVAMFYREEGVSGTLVNRPVLGEMLFSLEENGHGIKTVIVERLDRLARDLIVQETIIANFQKRGFSLISAHEGAKILEEDPSRVLIRRILGAVAEHDKKMLVLKMRAARERIRCRGSKCEGRKGYEELMPDTVELAKELRKRGSSYTEIAIGLNLEGHMTLSGQEFSARVVQDMLRIDRRRESLLVRG